LGVFIINLNIKIVVEDARVQPLSPLVSAELQKRLPLGSRLVEL
jgi:hypothetical protein